MFEGLSFQWYMGVGTGFMLGVAVCRIVSWAGEQPRATGNFIPPTRDISDAGPPPMPRKK